jgi:hypothetical protein
MRCCALEQLAGGAVPYSEPMIIACGEQEAPIGTELRDVDAPGVRGQFFDQAASRGFPQLGDRRPSKRDEALARRSEHDAPPLAVTLRE